MTFAVRVRLLLLFHLIVCVAFLLTAGRSGTPTWAGSLSAFAIPTVQLTWSFTVGVIVGPSRKRRKWLAAAGLLSFIPLSFTCIATWLIWHFVDPELAVTFALLAVGVLCVETVAGLTYGIICHNTWSEP